MWNTGGPKKEFGSCSKHPAKHWRLSSAGITCCGEYFKESTIAVAVCRVSRMGTGD